MAKSYTDIGYPLQPSSPALVPDFEAHFTDPIALSGINAQTDPQSGIFDGGLHAINNSGAVTQNILTVENISGIDINNGVVLIGSGVIPFLRPRYDPYINRSLPRVSGLSNAYEEPYQDLAFNKYIHYMPNPNGGRGLLDKTSFAVETDVTYSRNIKISTYSPYSGNYTVTAATTTTLSPN